jgi:hypothetical protein
LKIAVPFESIQDTKTTVLMGQFEADFYRENGGGVTRTHEDRSRGIYSPLQLPLCDTPEEKKEERLLAKGLEPSTVRLQGGCSTIELHQH